MLSHDNSSCPQLLRVFHMRWVIDNFLITQLCMSLQQEVVVISAHMSDEFSYCNSIM